MMWIEIFLIMLFVVAFLYWQAGQKVKEVAWLATQRYCQKMELQMLDGYIAFHKLSLKKDAQGRLHLLRLYVFEFSSTGAERYNGTISMLGQRVESIQPDPYKMSNTD